MIHIRESIKAMAELYENNLNSIAYDFVNFLFVARSISNVSQIQNS